MDLVRLCTDKYTDTLFSMWLLNTPYVFRAVWAVVSAALRTARREKFASSRRRSRALLSQSRDGRETGRHAPFAPGLGTGERGISARELVERAREDRRETRGRDEDGGAAEGDRGERAEGVCRSRRAGVDVSLATADAGVSLATADVLSCRG